MSHFSIISYLGKQRDKVTPSRAGTTIAEINVDPTANDSAYGFNSTLKGLAGLGILPDEIGIDLLLIAMMVMASDTRINRKKHAQDSWTREIDLYIPVSNPELWTENKQLLSNALRFLSGDIWTFKFRERPWDFSTLAHEVKQESEVTPTEVCLFSGGLDSYIGAINLLESGQIPLLVSHYSDGSTSDNQKKCINALEKKFTKESIVNLRSNIHFPGNIIADEKEDTTRARSFVFYSLAILAASGFDDGVDILIPENGFIALNVPLDTLRLGALSTRTAHPYFIGRMNKLVSSLGLNINLYNPYRHMTKGEMIEGCSEKKFLQQTIQDTMSCSSPTKGRFERGAPYSQHCGFCLPCLIRRSSIKRGMEGLSDPTPYRFDLNKKKVIDSNKAEGLQIRSFQVAANKLAKNPNLAKVLIHKPGPLTDFPDEVKSYEEMYLQGMHEVSDLLKQVVVRAGGK